MRKWLGMVAALALLTQATAEVKALLEPKGDADGLTFRLCEGLFIAKRV